MRYFSSITILMISFSGWLWNHSTAIAKDKVQYNRDIRPILAENCFACHGPDSASRKADLRLDQAKSALEAKAIIPGKVQESELIQRIFSEKAGEQMPPPKTHKTLKPKEKELLKRWIEEGAEYQLHWSLIAPKLPQLPKVQNQNWVRNPIDQFILAKLEMNHLKPSPEGDRRTLARRLSLDLTGLPPEPAEVERFVNDSSKDAYEKYVDHLMKSPHYGEHRARYWLDAARYADTHGIHFDNYREVWTYRDWVIDAFNKNMPFDQFTTEQLAGDLLPNRTLDQQIATGFNRCNITTNEGGAINEEYLVLYARDRTETASVVFMGMTAGCAVCHDHKFDPLSQKEFYQLSAFFNNTTQNAMDGNISKTPPIVFVPLAEDRKRFAELETEVAALNKRIQERKVASSKDFNEWLHKNPKTALQSRIPQDMLFYAPCTEIGSKEIKIDIAGKSRAVPLIAGTEWNREKKDYASLTIKKGNPIEIKDFGDFEKEQKFSVSAWIKIDKRNSTGALIARMDPSHEHRGWDLWVQGDQIGMHIINSWPNNALKVVSNKKIPLKKWTHIAVSYDGSAKSSGIHIYIDGEKQTFNVEADHLTQTIKTTVPFTLGQRANGERLVGASFRDLRVYARELNQNECFNLSKLADISQILDKNIDKLTPPDKDRLQKWWLENLDTGYHQLSSQLEKLKMEDQQIRARSSVASVMEELKSPPKAYVLFRGDYDKRRDQVTATTPTVLPPFPKDAPHNRLGLAKWLLLPEHPLTARVTVNRFWQEFFGNGIVRSSGDFGIMGELPSHPELLDWLAIEFRQSKWNMNHIIKLIVTSSTYRQIASATPELLEKDPNNILLARGPRFRMDAEMIRDYALKVSGLLNEKIGGPSVKPYQPDGVWEAVAMIGSNTRNYQRDKGDNLYRRSMYTFWKRAAPPASMDILNAPSRETCTVRRERTDTPLQALTTLNDTQFVEAARVFAEKILKDGGKTDETRIDFLAKRLLARSWTTEEQKIVLHSLQILLDDYKKRPEEAKKLIHTGEAKTDEKLDPATLAAWTMLANELMNLDEVLNK